MYRRRKASVYHRSLARHLRQAGAAAYCGDRRRVALGYLLQSLRHDPLATTTWKWLAKDLLPRDRFERAPHDAPEIA
jgi:hypothetical protein